MPSTRFLFVIRPPGREPYTVGLERLTELVRMGRLAKTLTKALDAKAGLETAVEADVVRFVDRVNQVHKRREAVFLAQHAALDADVTDLAELERDLEDFGKNERPGASGGSAYTGTGGEHGS